MYFLWYHTDAVRNGVVLKDAISLAYSGGVGTMASEGIITKHVFALSDRTQGIEK